MRKDQIPVANFYFDRPALEAACRRAGVPSRWELGRQVGLDDRNCYKYFNGNKPVGKVMASRVCTVLGCGMAEVLVVEMDGTRFRLRKE